eukprot:SAG22_NODE_45_length_24718_cov_12.462448_1_plen_113_part_00
MRSDDRITLIKNITGLIIITECYNLSSYIDDIHGWCGNDLNNVITQCESLCLLSIVDILNSCLEDLIKMRDRSELEYTCSEHYDAHPEDCGRHDGEMMRAAARIIKGGTSEP